MPKVKPIFKPDEDRALDHESGKQLRALRKEFGINQKAMAMELGVTNSYLCEIEQGRRILRVSMWNKAMEAINQRAQKLEKIREVL
jgi:transcriptional regulator with XRE-family HTH domain